MGVPLHPQSPPRVGFANLAPPPPTPPRWGTSFPAAATSWVLPPAGLLILRVAEVTAIAITLGVLAASRRAAARPSDAASAAAAAAAAGWGGREGVATAVALTISGTALAGLAPLVVAAALATSRAAQAAAAAGADVEAPPLPAAGAARVPPPRVVDVEVVDADTESWTAAGGPAARVAWTAGVAAGQVAATAAVAAAATTALNGDAGWGWTPTAVAAVAAVAAGAVSEGACGRTRWTWLGGLAGVTAAAGVVGAVGGGDGGVGGRGGGGECGPPSRPQELPRGGCATGLPPAAPTLPRQCRRGGTGAERQKGSEGVRGTTAIRRCCGLWWYASGGPYTVERKEGAGTPCSRARAHARGALAFPILFLSTPRGVRHKCERKRGEREGGGERQGMEEGTTWPCRPPVGFPGPTQWGGRTRGGPTAPQPARLDTAGRAGEVRAPPPRGGRRPIH